MPPVGARISERRLTGTRCRALTLCASLALCTATGGVRAEDWVDGRVCAPFVCRANFRLDDDRPLFDELARLSEDLRRQLRIRPSGEAVELYLFGDKGSYRDYIETKYPGAPLRRALFVKASGHGMVYAYRSRDFEIDLRHEATHALLHTALVGLPLWLDEGLAEYFETPAAERVYDPPHLASIRWNPWQTIAPLADLEAHQELDDLGRREYRDAWAWVHFCLHGPQEAQAELAQFLAELAEGKTAEPLSRRLARRLPGLDEQLARHLKTWKRPE